MQHENARIVDSKLSEAREKFKTAFGFEKWLLTNEITDMEGHYDESPMHVEYWVTGTTIYPSEVELIEKHLSDDLFFKKCLGALRKFRGRFKSGATARSNRFHDPSYGNLKGDPDFDRLYS